MRLVPPREKVKWIRSGEVLLEIIERMGKETIDVLERRRPLSRGEPP